MEDAILSVVAGALQTEGDNAKSIKIKKLRKMVLLSLQRDESEKLAKKEYKKAAITLEKKGKLILSRDGLVSLPRSLSKKRKTSNASDASTKKKKVDMGTIDVGHVDSQCSVEHGEDTKIQCPKLKQTPCHGNPQGITRLFVGNLPFAVDESSLKAFISGVTHIKWITDKESGAFYGSSFVEMESSSRAADAVGKTGSQLKGRPIKVNYAPARPGDVWPPTTSNKSSASHGSGGGGQAGGSGLKAMSVKPPDCRKLFIGNLSYDIDDDGISKFFGSVDAEVKAVRWLHHRDSGDFKGCGFVEFWNSDDCSKAASLNGKNLMGRPIRIDWTD